MLNLTEFLLLPQFDFYKVQCINWVFLPDRHGAAQEITAQTATEVDVTGNDCQQRKNYCRR